MSESQERARNTRASAAAVDASAHARPGVPMETEPPHPMPNAHWATPEPQPGAPLHVPKRTPVFGTAQPPKGLSGLLRKSAYQYPDHLTRRWLILMAADRVDAWEHRLARLGGVGGLAALAGLGGLLLARRARTE